MFWDDEIGLEREGKKNCQTMAEMIWYEFKEGDHRDTVVSLAESVRQAVAKKYPRAEVNCEII